MSQLDERRRTAFLKWLSVAVDEDRPYTIRVAAIRAVLNSLPERNPLRAIPAPELLERVKRPGDTRPARTPYGRYELQPVRRPPVCLADVF
jgi:hypothetical protein